MAVTSLVQRNTESRKIPNPSITEAFLTFLCVGVTIDFPVVFDSPNNAETDETKKRQIYRYICERITENQLIVSGLGFSGDEILDSFDSVITLTNNKYELLCREDYDANVSLLRELNNK